MACNAVALTRSIFTLLCAEPLLHWARIILCWVTVKHLGPRGLINTQIHLLLLRWLFDLSGISNIINFTFFSPPFFFREHTDTSVALVRLQRQITQSTKGTRLRLLRLLVRRRCKLIWPDSLLFCCKNLHYENFDPFSIQCTSYCLFDNSFSTCNVQD